MGGMVDRAGTPKPLSEGVSETRGRGLGAAGAAAARWLFPVAAVTHDTRWWPLEVKRSIKLMESCWTWLAWGEVTEAADNSLVSPLGWVKFPLSS